MYIVGSTLLSILTALLSVRQMEGVTTEVAELAAAAGSELSLSRLDIRNLVISRPTELPPEAEPPDPTPESLLP